MLIRYAIPILLCATAMAAEVVPAPPTPGPPGTSPPPATPDPSALKHPAPPGVVPGAGAAGGERSAAPAREGRVSDLEDIHAVNTVDPVNGRPVDGMKWVFAVHAGQVASGSAQGMTYIAFASEASLVEFERADPETRRRYIDIARGAQPDVDPRTKGEPAPPSPLTTK